MIYRNRKTLFFPQENGTYQAQACKSINAAKRQSREVQKAGNKVRVGRPPVEQQVTEP